MQHSNSLISLLCLVALVAFGASAILGLLIILRRGHRVAVPEPARSHDVPPSLAPPRALIAAAPPSVPLVAPSLPYAAIPTLLTSAEQNFFVALQAAVPDGLLICPQVRLANLVRPTARQRKQNTYDFYRIQAKCVDFVLRDRATTAPRLVIELDDASHARPDRRERDAFVDAVLATARLPVLHVPWLRRYDAAQLAAAIRHALGLAVHASAPPPDEWASPIAVESHIE